MEERATVQVEKSREGVLDQGLRAVLFVVDDQSDV